MGWVAALAGFTRGWLAEKLDPYAPGGIYMRLQFWAYYARIGRLLFDGHSALGW